MSRQNRNDTRSDRPRDSESHEAGTRRYPYEPRTGGSQEADEDTYRRNPGRQADDRDGRFDNDDTGYARSGRDFSRDSRDDGRARDGAGPRQANFDETYPGRSARSDWERRGSDGVRLPEGTSSYLNGSQSQDQAHRGKGPKDYQRSDERIREDVCDRLADDGAIDASDITVRVEKGEVTLDGYVGSRREKRAAEDCVDSISGILHCQNNLRVAGESRVPRTEPQTSGTEDSQRETSARKPKQS